MNNTDMVKSESIRDLVRDDMTQLLKASIAPNTLKAYNHALGALQTYLDGKQITDHRLADYITQMHTDGKSPATIAQVVAAVKWRLKHSQTGAMDFKLTDATLAGIRRSGKDRGRGQVDALNWQDTERVCAFCESDNTLAGLRDSAMIRIMSDGLLRISEMVAINYEDLQKNTLNLKSSKTDQEGAGVALYITKQTRKIIKKYLDKAEIEDGAIFRRIRRGDHIQSQRLTADAARRIIKARATDAGIDGFISGHSLRVGSAVSLAQAGASLVDLQVAGRWKNSQMPAHYARAEIAQRGAIAKYKEKQKTE